MITIGYFDLETNSLNADFGVILCGVVKDTAGTTRVYRADEINPNWDKGRSDDSLIVRAIADDLENLDVLVAHNGSRYDLPFLRTRMARWGMTPLRPKKIIDPCSIAFRQFRMSRNSLARLADMVGENNKTEVTSEMWMKASLDGDREAMNYIVEHCISDVDMLEKVADLVKGYIPFINERGSA